MVALVSDKALRGQAQEVAWGLLTYKQYGGDRKKAVAALQRRRDCRGVSSKRCEAALEKTIALWEAIGRLVNARISEMGERRKSATPCDLCAAAHYSSDPHRPDCPWGTPDPGEAAVKAACPGFTAGEYRGAIGFYLYYHWHR